jgi:hypothetical protein
VCWIQYVLLRGLDFIWPRALSREHTRDSPYILRVRGMDAQTSPAERRRVQQNASRTDKDMSWVHFVGCPSISDALWGLQVTARPIEWLLLSRRVTRRWKLAKNGYHQLDSSSFYEVAWDWVHSVLWPPTGLLYQSMEHLVKWELAGESEVLWRNLPRCQVPGATMGSRQLTTWISKWMVCVGCSVISQQWDG